MRSMVRNAARLAVYDEMMMSVKNHHELPMIRPASDLQQKKQTKDATPGDILVSKIISERQLTFTLAIMLSPVCLSVCRWSVTLVRPTQAVEIFGNISTAFGTLAIR